MSELIPINVVIGDRSYRIKLAPGDEEKVRRTIRLINEKILEFRTQFAGKDMQDYIAMVVLWYATLPGESEGKGISDQALADGLQRLEQQLDQVIPS